MTKSERLSLIANAVNTVQNNNVLTQKELNSIVDNEYCIKHQSKLDYKQLNFN